MQAVACKDVPSLRTAMSRSTGYKGASILHRFHALYGFDVIWDLIFDAMHNMPLNVAKQHLKRYIEEKLINPKEVDKILQFFLGLLVSSCMNHVTHHFCYAYFMIL